MFQVPRTTRLGFVLRGYTSDGKIENLAAGSVTLLDVHGAMRQGELCDYIFFFDFSKLKTCKQLCK